MLIRNFHWKIDVCKLIRTFKKRGADVEITMRHVILHVAKLIIDKFMRLRGYVEALSTRQVWRARKR